MVEIDPLVTGGQSALDRLDDHPVAPAEQRADRFRGGDQPIGEHEQLVVRLDQLRDRAPVAADLKAGPGAFGGMLDRDHFARQAIGEADYPLAAQRERGGELVMHDAPPAQPQQATRGRRVVGARFQR